MSGETCQRRERGGDAVQGHVYMYREIVPFNSFAGRQSAEKMRLIDEQLYSAFEDVYEAMLLHNNRATLYY